MAPSKVHEKMNNRPWNKKIKKSYCLCSYNWCDFWREGEVNKGAHTRSTHMEIASFGNENER